MTRPAHQGHAFGENLACKYCPITWAEHQEQQKDCDHSIATPPRSPAEVAAERERIEREAIPRLDTPGSVEDGGETVPE